MHHINRMMDGLCEILVYQKLRKGPSSWLLSAEMKPFHRHETVCLVPD
jgi:hypothetical protein